MVITVYSRGAVDGATAAVEYTLWLAALGQGRSYVRSKTKHPPPRKAEYSNPPHPYTMPSYKRLKLTLSEKKAAVEWFKRSLEEDDAPRSTQDTMLLVNLTQCIKANAKCLMKTVTKTMVSGSPPAAAAPPTPAPAAAVAPSVKPVAASSHESNSSSSAPSTGPSPDESKECSGSAPEESEESAKVSEKSAKPSGEPAESLPSETTSSQQQACAKSASSSATQRTNPFANLPALPPMGPSARTSLSVADDGPLPPPVAGDGAVPSSMDEGTKCSEKEPAVDKTSDVPKDAEELRSGEKASSAGCSGSLTEDNDTPMRDADTETGPSNAVAAAAADAGVGDATPSVPVLESVLPTSAASARAERDAAKASDAAAWTSLEENVRNTPQQMQDVLTAVGVKRKADDVLQSELEAQQAECSPSKKKKLMAIDGAEMHRAVAMDFTLLGNDSAAKDAERQHLCEAIEEKYRNLSTYTQLLEERS